MTRPAKRRLPPLALSALLAAGCGSLEAGVGVTVEGSLASPIASLHVEVSSAEGGRLAALDFSPPNGETEIMLPSDLGVVLQTDRRGARAGHLDGAVDVCVTARDATSAALDTDCVSATIARGEVTEVVLTLGDGASPDGGEPGTDAQPDAGATDSGGTCGDGVRTGTEECDGMDLAGADCGALGFSGGTPACGPACAFDTSGCIAPPTVPVPRAPMNASYMGSVYVPGSLRPSFVWGASTVGGGLTLGYELELGTDPAFSAPVPTTVMTAFTNHVPSADLTVSMAPPVGARYWWRVRACAGAACSAYSPAWYVNVGRSDRDFNGDGYADVVVGAPNNDAGGLDSGRVYVYLGGSGASFDVTIDSTITGEAPGDQFGISVAPAGDVDADGYADLLVGALFSDVGGTDAGRAYLFRGGPGATLDGAADAVLTGAVPDGNFGMAVSGAGDLNADGFADIVVGAPATFGAAADPGNAYVYFGGPTATLDTTADGILAGAPGDRLGGAVSSAGDANGDGYGDLLVGAFLCDDTAVEAGCAYLFAGAAGATFDETPDLTLTGAASTDNLGTAVAGGGDLNGDAFADWVVGAPLNDGGGPNAGRAYVYFGGATLDGSADATLTGAGAGDQFGNTLAAAGDLNGDGFDDVIIGAHLNDAAGTDAGRGYVYFGGLGATFNATVDGTLTGEAAGDDFAVGVAGGDDVNGDNVGDIIVGARLSDGSVVNGGRAYVFFGATGPAFDATPEGTLNGAAALDAFGRAVAAASKPEVPRPSVALVGPWNALRSPRRRLTRRRPSLVANGRGGA